jgi:hypothetical protein
MRLLKATLLSAAFVAFAATSASAQRSGNFENSWFWGVKGGVSTLSTTGGGSASVPTWGADWLITRSKGGLYVSADESFFSRSLTAVDTHAPGGTRQVKISNMRRVDFAGMVFPTTFGPVRPYAGVGAAVSIIASAVAQPDSLGGSPDQTFTDRTDKQRSRASILVIGGAQIQMKRSAFFIQETVLPSSGDFLISSAMSFFEIGFRYNFGSSIESSR